MLPAQRRHCASAPSSLPSEPEAPPFEPLHFDSSFESGNLAEAKLIAELPLEYDLYIRPDTLNARHRVWFFFSVSNARKNQKALFNLIGYSKTKSLFRDGMAPVVSSSRRPYWERMPQSAVYYYRSPRHDRQRYLHSLDLKQLPYYRRECLCRTVQDRRLDMITISSPANLIRDATVTAENVPPTTSDGPHRPVFVISARVHPGESPASLLMHGLLAFLTSSHPKAVAVRERVIIKLVPMLNPDGVFLGNYRCNSLGLDLNRLWHTPVAIIAPTIQRVRDMLLLYAKHPTCRLNLFVDMHAHSTCMNGFVYANVPEDPKDLDAVAAFPRALANHSPTFAFSGTKYCADPSKAGTGRRALAEMLPRVHCYTLEVSFFCSAVGNVRGEPYTPTSYTDMGHSIGMALHEYDAGGGENIPGVKLEGKEGREGKGVEKVGSGHVHKLKELTAPHGHGEARPTPPVHPHTRRASCRPLLANACLNTPPVPPHNPMVRMSSSDSGDTEYSISAGEGFGVSRGRELQHPTPLRSSSRHGLPQKLPSRRLIASREKSSS